MQIRKTRRKPGDHWVKVGGCCYRKGAIRVICHFYVPGSIICGNSHLSIRDRKSATLVFEQGLPWTDSCFFSFSPETNFHQDPLHAVTMVHFEYWTHRLIGVYHETMSLWLWVWKSDQSSHWLNSSEETMISPLFYPCLPQKLAHFDTRWNLHDHHYYYLVVVCHLSCWSWAWLFWARDGCWFLGMAWTHSFFVTFLSLHRISLRLSITQLCNQHHHYFPCLPSLYDKVGVCSTTDPIKAYSCRSCGHPIWSSLDC